MNSNSARNIAKELEATPTVHWPDAGAESAADEADEVVSVNSRTSSTTKSISIEEISLFDRQQWIKERPRRGSRTLRLVGKLPY